MILHFRAALRGDVPNVVALLADDSLGAMRETAPLADYFAAFERMATDARCTLVVAESGGHIVGCYDLIVLDGLNMRGERRAQVEGVRIARHLRGQKLGDQLMNDAFTRARAAGCSYMELLSNAARPDAHRFYERLGFTRSHLGFKRNL